MSIQTLIESWKETQRIFKENESIAIKNPAQISVADVITKMIDELEQEIKKPSFVVVLASETAWALQGEINGYLQNGYELYGNVVAVPSSEKGSLYDSLVQVMIKK
jgi:hypothetical protein